MVTLPTDPPPSLPARAAWTAVPSGTERMLAGFLHTLDLDADALARGAGALGRLRQGSLQAVLVHGVLPSAVLHRIRPAKSP